MNNNLVLSKIKMRSQFKDKNAAAERGYMYMSIKMSNLGGFVYNLETIS